MNTILKFFAPIWSPKQCYQICAASRPWLGIFALLALIYGVVAGLFIAPPDYQQGDAYRIIFIHVPFAMLSMMLYGLMGVLSLSFLIWRIKVAELMAYSLAPIGAMMAVLALITGSIWGKPMWGTWWVWDARLTSELILLFLYLGYIALYDAIKANQPKSLAPAILAVVGLVDLPIIHYSVYWWQTLHQGSTITRFSKPAIDASMLYPLLAMIVGILSFCLFLLTLRLQTQILQAAENTDWVKNNKESAC